MLEDNLLLMNNCLTAEQALGANLLATLVRLDFGLGHQVQFS